jgi:hypothetical protein
MGMNFISLKVRRIEEASKKCELAARTGAQV